MDIAIDRRLGSELGLNGVYKDVPAFQIINDSAARLACLTARIVSVKYGARAEELLRHPDWARVDRGKIEFSRRLEAIGTDAVAAAVFDAEIRSFELEIVDPLFAMFEKSVR